MKSGSCICFQFLGLGLIFVVSVIFIIFFMICFVLVVSSGGDRVGIVFFCLLFVVLDVVSVSFPERSWLSLLFSLSISSLSCSN